MNKASAGIKIAMMFITGKVSRREYPNSFQLDATIMASEKISAVMLQNSDCRNDFPKAKRTKKVAKTELKIPT